ncbi:MAG: hypothetical protein ABWU84_11315 [Pyrobaculum sp.]|uniref:hypothetical protein n=1 Tax=Pyrobaculum sp. TaxID=2004705 RepID=UPI003EEAD2EE
MPSNIPCYYKGLFIMIPAYILLGLVNYLIVVSPAPLVLKIFILFITIGASFQVLLWIPKESYIQERGVLLIGLVRRRFIEGEVVEEYTYDEVKRRLSFVPVGNRVILQCFFWGFYGSFQRRSGEWVGVDVYAGRDCRGRWLLVRRRGQDRYLLVCPGNV